MKLVTSPACMTAAPLIGIAAMSCGVLPATATTGAVISPGVEGVHASA
jgi:hypothetical protein